MKNVYRVGSLKSGPVVRRVDAQPNRVIQMGGVNHATIWTRPVKAKTAAELLEKDDEKPGTLTADQRLEMSKRAGDKYKKRDPFLKRPTESQKDYIRRINKMMG